MFGFSRRIIIWGRVYKYGNWKLLTQNFRFFCPPKWTKDFRALLQLSDKSSDVVNFEELVMGTDLLCLIFSEQNLYYFTRPAVKKQWDFLCSGDCTDDVSGNSTTNFVSRTCCTKQKHTMKCNLVSVKNKSTHGNDLFVFVVMTLEQKI